jgi:hypothetical protein
MLKIIYLSLVLCFTLSTALCQPTRRDSLIKAARTDAKSFRLADTIWKKHKRTLPPSSDYFKPKDGKQTHSTLIVDSVYVEAYRKAAYKSNKHRRTPWHYMLVGGGITAGLYIIFAAAIIIYVAPTMN